MQLSDGYLWSIFSFRRGSLAFLVLRCHRVSSGEAQNRNLPNQTCSLHALTPDFTFADILLSISVLISTLRFLDRPSLPSESFVLDTTRIVTSALKVVISRLRQVLPSRTPARSLGALYYRLHGPVHLAVSIRLPSTLFESLSGHSGSVAS